MFHQKKQSFRGPGGNNMRSSEKARKAEEEEIISKSKAKVRKVESDEDDSGFECYNRPDSKLVHVDIDKSHRRITGTGITTEQIGGRKNI